MNFITDKYKRFFFNSKWSQRLYTINNTIASSSLGYWIYRYVGVLGTTNRFLLQRELSKSLLAITYFTCVTCRFWAHITSPFPKISRVFDGMSHRSMSPVWLVEFLVNKVTGPIFKAIALKTKIPLNIIGPVPWNSGLICEKLNYTFTFI